MSLYEYEYQCPICGRGQNREGICNECAWDIAIQGIKDNLLRLLHDVDVAENEGNKDTFEKVVNWDSFVQNLPENAHNIKLSFEHFKNTYEMFLKAHYKNDRNAVKQFTQDIKTILRWLRSRIIEYLQNL